MNKINKRFFQIAKEISLLSTFKRTHIGAVVVEGKRVISTGFNSNKTNPLQERYNRFRDFDEKLFPACEHAEVHALNNLIGKPVEWKRVSIYTYREANGQRACSRPCKACEKLIKDLGIKNMFYVDMEGNYCKESVL